MYMHRPLVSAIVALAMLGGVGLSAIASDLSPSNKWRIEVSESAKSDGVIRFRVTSEGGEPVEVAVPIKDGRSENGVARDIRDVFAGMLDKERFKVEVDDGEDVLVKKRSGAASFELKLVESTVKAVRLNVDKE